MAVVLHTSNSLSAFLGSFTTYHFEKLSKNIMCIVRTWCCLRVELYAQHRFVSEPQAFERVIVQAFVSDFHFVGIQISSRDTVIMILRGDENCAIPQILNGMIPAMMTKLEFVCVRAKCTPDELMPETDSKNGDTVVK